MSAIPHIFIAYARRDTDLLEELRLHLKPLERTGRALIWYDGLIEPGAVWEESIKKNLHRADIILLLVSAHAIASDYFYEKEMTDALYRHEQGAATVVPLIIRPCTWRATPLSKLQALPKDGKPVSSWNDTHEAWSDAVEAILTLIEEREQVEQARQIEEARRLEAARKKAEEAAARQKALVEREKQQKAALINLFEKDMVKIAGGTFQMGDEKGDLWEACRPTRTVTVLDFYLSKYPVTVAQFQRFIEENPGYQTDADKMGGSYTWNGKEWKLTPNVNWKCDVKGDLRPVKDYDHPVIHISWNDAVAFCDWLKRKTSREYRLPTEAEWEYAARGGQQSKGYLYAGSNDLDEVGWYENNSSEKTHPVGSKKPNELGLYDMSGHVWEWCEDVWHDTYDDAPKDGSAWISGGKQDRRVVRGGSWFVKPVGCRVASRSWFNPAFRINEIGFRLAR